MRRGDYWLVFTELCHRYPLGVELCTPGTFGGWWEIRVRTPDEIVTGHGRTIADVVECVATNLGVTIDIARAAA